MLRLLRKSVPTIKVPDWSQDGTKKIKFCKSASSRELAILKNISGGVRAHGAFGSLELTGNLASKQVNTLFQVTYTMDMWGIAMTVDAVVIIILAVEYRNVKNLYDSFVAALRRGINSATVSEIKAANEARQPLYAIIRGHVKAVGPPIKSLNKPSVNGVIQKLTIKEHAAQKDSFGIWFNRERVIDTKYNVVPFELRKGNYKITITSPQEAKYLNLVVIEDHFEPTVSSFINRLLFGFHQKGFQYTELLLKEDAFLTGFGEVNIASNRGLQLTPPRNGMRYILTTMDPETFIHELKTEKKILGYSLTLSIIIGICLASIVVWKWWYARSKRLELERLRTEAVQQRERQVNDLTQDSFICIVCCVRPREIVLLPCGHVSLCADCSTQLCGQPCPVCRRRVTQQILIYMS